MPNFLLTIVILNLWSIFLSFAQKKGRNRIPRFPLFSDYESGGRARILRGRICNIVWFKDTKLDSEGGYSYFDEPNS